MKYGILINGYLHTFKNECEAKQAIKKQFHNKIKPINHFNHE